MYIYNFPAYISCMPNNIDDVLVKLCNLFFRRPLSYQWLKWRSHHCATTRIPSPRFRVLMEGPPFFCSAGVQRPGHLRHGLKLSILLQKAAERHLHNLASPYIHDRNPYTYCIRIPKYFIEAFYTETFKLHFIRWTLTYSRYVNDLMMDLMIEKVKQ